jgi:hypothetical protein
MDSYSEYDWKESLSNNAVTDSDFGEAAPTFSDDTICYYAMVSSTGAPQFRDKHDLPTYVAGYLLKSLLQESVYLDHYTGPTFDTVLYPEGKKHVEEELGSGFGYFVNKYALSSIPTSRSIFPAIPKQPINPKDFKVLHFSKDKDNYQ